MKITLTKNKSTVLAAVVFEKDEWKKAQDKAYVKLGQKVEVKGFRKGHAPIEQLKKHIQPGEAFEEASMALANESFNKILNENELDLVLRPDYKIIKISNVELEIEFEFTVRPEIVLGAYKDVEIKKDKVSVTEKEVNAKLEELQKQYATVAAKEDGIIAEGNIVKFDFEGFADGKAFEGGKAENYELEIGSHAFIPGFEEQMIGLKVGEKKDIEVTFPEQYAKELAGKKAIFKLNIKEVNVKTLPAIDDDLALDANIEGVSTLEELKNHIKEDIKKEKTKTAEDKAYNDLVDTIVKTSTFELPEKVIEADLNNSYESFKQRVEQQGIPFEKYFEIANTTEEKIKETLRVDVIKNLNTIFVLGKIADVEKITVKPEDVEAEYERIAKQYSMEDEKVKEILKPREQELANELFYSRIGEFLKNNNKIA